MAVYNPKSLKAEEFINHDEILETIRYAKANKNNVELIDSILEKARPRRSADGRSVYCSGLTHRAKCEKPRLIHTNCLCINALFRHCLAIFLRRIAHKADKVHNAYGKACLMKI